MVKPKPNPKSTEEMPIERSVFNKDMATISNPIPIMTKRSVFSLKKNRRAMNREIMYPRVVPTKNGTGIPTFPSTKSFRKGCTIGISKPGTNVIRIRLIAGTHPRSNKKRSKEEVDRLEMYMSHLVGVLRDTEE